MDSIYLEYMVKRERVVMDWVKRIGLVLGLIIINFLVLNFEIIEQREMYGGKQRYLLRKVF